MDENSTTGFIMFCKFIKNQMTFLNIFNIYKCTKAFRPVRSQKELKGQNSHSYTRIEEMKKKNKK